MDYTPVPVAGESYPDIFPAWREVLEFGVPASFVYLVLGAVAVIILYQWIHDRLQKRQDKRELARVVRRAAADHHLNEAESQALQDALLAAGVNAPEAALASEAYFNRFVAPQINRKTGSHMLEILREKLFTPLPAPEPGELATETQAIAVGQQLRLRFSGYPGAYRAVVIGVDPQGLLVSFSDRTGRDMQLNRYDRVTGVFEQNGELISFQTEVLEASSNEVYTCRLAHSTRVQHLKRRESVRVPVSRPIRFEWVPAEALQKPSGDHPSTHGKHRPREGTLIDLSLGGCAIGVGPDAMVSEHDIVIFRLDITDEIEPIDCVGRVLSLEIRREENRGILHVAFLGENESRRQRLGLVLAHLQGDGEPPADNA
jgi:c-di-GMP-binding flagellar brake protein YcgR/heme exporter protein D